MNYKRVIMKIAAPLSLTLFLLCVLLFTIYLLPPNLPPNEVLDIGAGSMEYLIRSIITASVVLLIVLWIVTITTFMEKKNNSEVKHNASIGIRKER